MAVALGALWPVDAVVVDDLDASRTLVELPARPGQEVVLRYRHSRYGGEVWEHLVVQRGGFLLTKLVAEREAALESYGLPHPIRHREGRAVLAGLRIPVGELVVRATALGERTLLVAGQVIPLAVGREGHRIRIRVGKAPVARLIGSWMLRKGRP